MNIPENKYVTPEVTTLILNTEQVICSQSTSGGLEDIIDDNEDYGDFFE